MTSTSDNLRPHCYPPGVSLEQYLESVLVSPRHHRPLKYQGGVLIDQATGETYPVEGDCPNFLPERAITEHQVSELDFALQWVKDLEAGKVQVPHLDVKRYFDQTKICYDPFLPWINSQTVKPDTKLVCIGGCFCDDLPHVFSYYKYNVDHLSIQYLRNLPAIKGSHTHYLNCTSEQMPFSNEWADIIYTRNSIDHVTSPIETIQEVWRILKPGGKLCIGVYYNSTFVNEHESTVIDEDFIAQVITPLFTILHKEIKEMPEMPAELTFNGKPTQWLMLICEKKADGAATISRHQARVVKNLLHAFHSSLFHADRRNPEKALEGFKEVVQFEPVLETDVGRILLSALYISASAGLIPFVSLASFILRTAPTPAWQREVEKCRALFGLQLHEPGEISLETRLDSIAQATAIGSERLMLLLSVLAAGSNNPVQAAYLLEQAIHPPYQLTGLKAADLLQLYPLV